MTNAILGARAGLKRGKWKEVFRLRRFWRFNEHMKENTLARPSKPQVGAAVGKDSLSVTSLFDQVSDPCMFFFLF